MLESRTLLSSAGVTQSVLHIVGDASSANTITVRRTSDTEITVSMNGKADQVFGQCDTITGIDIKGGSGADRLAVDESSQALGVGVSMEGGAGNDTLIGSNSDDSLDGGAGDDSIVGNGGNDRIAGREGNDTILAGAGDDSIKGNAGNDVVDGGAGNDSVWATTATTASSDVATMYVPATALTRCWAAAATMFSMAASHETKWMEEPGRISSARDENGD